ncbi:MAG: hypothetical protein ACN2B6_06265 [Rickettsiales bacterium]
MIIDSIDTSDLGSDPQEAFIIFEQRLSVAYAKAVEADRDLYYYQGDYTGNYLPDREYVSCILSFLDVYDLDYKLDDITEESNHHFPESFQFFRTRISRLKTTFALLKCKNGTGSIGTPIQIAPNFKEEITKNIQTIRKIVNQEVDDQNKRDAIFSKLNALQAEIDRDRTTMDALLNKMSDFSKAVGECGENIEPLVSRVERLSNSICKVIDRIPGISSRKPPAQITSEVRAEPTELEDEIPF